MQNKTPPTILVLNIIHCQAVPVGTLPHAAAATRGWEGFAALYGACPQFSRFITIHATSRWIWGSKTGTGVRKEAAGPCAPLITPARTPLLLPQAAKHGEQGMPRSIPSAAGSEQGCFAAPQNTSSTDRMGQGHLAAPQKAISYRLVQLPLHPSPGWSCPSLPHRETEARRAARCSERHRVLSRRASAQQASSWHGKLLVSAPLRLARCAPAAPAGGARNCSGVSSVNGGKTAAFCQTNLKKKVTQH